MERSTRRTDLVRSAVLTCGLLALVASPLGAQRGPAPTMLKLDPQVLALACAPTLTTTAPAATLQVTGGQDTFKRTTHFPGDLVTINGGMANGVQVGQEYYIRRVQKSGRGDISEKSPAVVRTVGWLRVWALDRPDLSLATITHACETIDIGDYLEPFSLPTMPAVSTETLKPERDNYGRVMMGDDRRQTFAKGDFFILDRGSAQGVTPGARFVIFRDKLQYQNFLYDLGEAVAVNVGQNSATLQVTVSRDALFVGDYVAIRNRGD
jgi:hypothetical protein